MDGGVSLVPPGAEIEAVDGAELVQTKSEYASRVPPGAATGSLSDNVVFPLWKTAEMPDFYVLFQVVATRPRSVIAL